MNAHARGFVRSLLFALCSLLLVPCAPAWAQPAAYNIGAVPGWEPTVLADGTVVLTAPDAGPPEAWVILLPVRALQANFEAQFEAERVEMERTWGLGAAQGVQRRQGRGDTGAYQAWGATYVVPDGIRVLLLHGLSGKGVMGLGVFVAASAPAFARHAQAGGALISSLQLSDAARPAAPVRANRSGNGAQPWPAWPVGAENGNGAITQAGTAQPAPATPAAASSSPASLSWSVPAGWTRAARGSTIVLTSPPNEMSGQRNVLEVLPAERAQGTPVQTFAALWQRLIGPRFDTALHPLPLRVRLAGGAMLIFDGETRARERASGNTVGAHLYVVTDGVTAVPLIAVQRDWNQFRGELATFFASARLSGGGRTAAPLYTLAEVAGTWRSSSSTSASYVDSAGNYRGDASMATGQTLTIGADGSCTSQFAAVGGGNGRLRSSARGRCAVEDDTLVVPSEAGPRRYRITGVGRTADRRAGFLLLGITREDYPLLDASSEDPAAGDVYVSQP